MEPAHRHYKSRKAALDWILTQSDHVLAYAAEDDTYGWYETQDGLRAYFPDVPEYRDHGRWGEFEFQGLIVQPHHGNPDDYEWVSVYTDNCTVECHLPDDLMAEIHEANLQYLTREETDHA